MGYALGLAFLVLRVYLSLDLGRVLTIHLLGLLRLLLRSHDQLVYGLFNRGFYMNA